MSRASQQAMLFGADVVYNRAVSVVGRSRVLVIGLADGAEAVAEAVLVASGDSYRRSGAPQLEALLGAGVLVAATSEAHSIRGQEVYVVGAGNSAGPAAIHLAKHAAQVTLLVRGDCLQVSMSDYLIRQLGDIPTINVRLSTDLVGGGSGRLEWLEIEEGTAEETERVSADALFVLIVDEPSTEWLSGTVARDRAGFI